MSGFFVSNSFGTFNSEAVTKKFNADTDIIGWGGTTSTGTFYDVLDGSSPAAPGYYLEHEFKNTDAHSSSMVPTWAKWSGEKLELKGSHNYGIKVKGASDATAWYEIEVPSGCVLGGTGHIGPSTDDHGWVGSILTAAGNSRFPSVTFVGGGKNSTQNSVLNKVRVELTKSTHYISLDPAAEIGGIGTFTIKLDDKDGRLHTFSRSNSPGNKLSRSTACSDTGGTYGTPMYLSLISWTKWRDGCRETDASNYDALATREDGSCQYIPAPISTFTISKTSVIGGANESVLFDWTLDSSDGKDVSLVTLYANNTDESDQEIASWGPSVFSQTLDYNTSSLPVGTTTFRLVAVWDKNSGNPDDESVTLNVSSPQTLINCNDPNASKYGESSLSGDCGTCNSGYYLGDDGLCTNCELSNPDPYRDMDTTTGQCGECLPDYAEHTDGTCQKVGCMDEDDYEYDPDAVIDDPSACEGAGDVPADVDCVLSAWSEYSDWSDPDTESGTRTRERTIKTAPSGYGAACEHLEETDLGVLDPDTGDVIITTTAADPPANGGTPPADDEPGSPVVPIVVGVVVLGALFMMMRR